jgi:hypothetical protein
MINNLRPASIPLKSAYRIGLLGATVRVTVGQKLKRFDYITGVSFYNTTEKVALASSLLLHEPF